MSVAPAASHTLTPAGNAIIVSATTRESVSAPGSVLSAQTHFDVTGKQDLNSTLRYVRRRSATPPSRFCDFVLLALGTQGSRRQKSNSASMEPVHRLPAHTAAAEMA
jgi:hypothetical protein